MTAVQIIELISDVCIVGFFSLVVIMYIILAIKYIFTGKGFEEPEEEDIYIEKLDKLQNTIDCLASKHLDAETMRELQGASEEAKAPEKPYIPPMTRPFDEDCFDKYIGYFNSAIDRFLYEDIKNLKSLYKKLPADDDVRQKHKRAKIDEEIGYYRFFISFWSFLQTHGYDAFEVYLRRMCFMQANDEATERKNNIEGEEAEKQHKEYEAPELTFFENEAQKLREDLEKTEQKNDEK